MARYVVVIGASGAAIVLDSELSNLDENIISQLSFDLANHLDDGVELEVKLKQQGPTFHLSQTAIELTFLDVGTGDKIYTAKGFLDPDENLTSSIVSVLDAMDDFSEVELENFTYPGFESDIADLNCFNEYDSLGRNAEKMSVPTAPMPNVPTVYSIITSQDIAPNDLYMQFTDDFGLFTQMLRAANKLNVGLWVELDPTLTLDQVYMVAADLAPMDHHVRLVWSPIRARPLDAVGLKGKKIARLVGGFILGQLLKRRAKTNVHGIPPLHTPIAGFDFPVNFVGIEQNPDVILDDFAHKQLAALQVNVVQRSHYESGVRFEIGDCLTAYGNNTSVLKLTNASDVSMFVDNRLKSIIKRHLLKAMETMIEDALKECVAFLDACTTKDRPLLVRGEEFSGYYDLSIVPREDRPFDAVAVKCRYRPQGAARAAFLDTEVTK
ncbi:MAG: hypothetical protein ACN6OV_01195 [Acinetobacter sp.]|uniref:hypothetical protein n=1 Tax=Acinetobacter sp. TaxID=472 RepID=UPI003CFF557E